MSLEPHVRAEAGALESPTTGILDSHSYMQFLHGSFASLGGDTALNSTVTAITPLPSSAGYELTVADGATMEEMTISCETLINSAGLGACQISNLLLPEDRHVTPYYAKGNYYSYSASSPRTTRLIYPAPEPGLGGLGTHLTMDLGGAIRFGPDVEWVDDPSNLAVSTDHRTEAIREIKKYLPEINEDRVVPDYAGIRPKLSPKGTRGVVDFVIRKEEGFDGYVNLLGIESPGLTASLAIAEKVEGFIYR